MRRFPIAAIALGLLVASLAAQGPSVWAQPVASIALPAPGETRQLYPGCNNIGLTFADGTASEMVVEAVTPSEAVAAIWRHDAALSKWEAYSPVAVEASDLLTVNFLDAVWLCTGTALPA